jgi:hypothetical protein
LKWCREDLKVYLTWFLLTALTALIVFAKVKGIVSQDFGIIFLFYWIDVKFLIGQDQVYLTF